MIFEPLLSAWKSADFESILEAFVNNRKVRISGIRGSARSFFFLLLQKHLQMPLLVLTRAKYAESDFSDLNFLCPLLGAPQPIYFPALDTEPYQGVSPHPQISVMRMQALWHISTQPSPVVVAPLQAAVQWIAPAASFQRSYQRVEWGDERSPVDLASVLRGFGYREKDLVISKGEFARRGGILDVFSAAEESPVRMEFFGNRIESMRTFDPATQRSQKEIEGFTVLALNEMQLSQKELDTWGRFCETRWQSGFHQEELTDKTEQLLQFGTFEGYEEFARAFFNPAATLLHHVPQNCCVLLDDPALLEETHATLLRDYRKRFDQVHETYRLALEPEEIFQSWNDFLTAVNERYVLPVSELVVEPDPDELLLENLFQTGRTYHGQMQEIIQDALKNRENGYTSYFVLPTAGKAERLAEVLAEYESPVALFHDPRESVEVSLEGKQIVTIGNLRYGFKNSELRIALFTEDDLFGESHPVVIEKRKVSGKFLSDFRDLKTGDYVVHVDHGIGQFLGLNTMFMEGQEREFLVLSFADDDKLYVPVERLDLVQKYMGASDAAPRLEKLGSNLWQKTKSRARASMKEMAEKLLQLYAYRKTVKGHSFPPDDIMQREFEDAFEFQETPHQLAAIEDVKTDMESDQPADRLICGDVGYGKTEVALRAAFKAVTGGKQVAVLAPTTILAFQHFNTFRQRFEMFPVTVEMISRFRTRTDIKATLQRTSEGRVDILIGTHRLLSKDVIFRDLGLLIVDEEQRFGVGHKERLKEIKKNVDAITLTATPIPRTLQMALMGFRPMSVIETPPKDRLAIQTNIVKYNEDTIETAIRAELKRGGQVYFVHNRVETIHSIGAMVRRLVPEARIAIAHGQMEESDLEKVMMQFIRHESDVLVSTTIIENGIDIPLVNTLIVNRADRFGLSQLYQLRGRVGRSHRRAYAYFLIPSEKELTPVARKRLSALREFTELGSGFRLAALDLEIRGAGNLLGSEQHGHIASLGFELYCRLLEQTVKEMQGEEAPADLSTAINLNLDIRIPEEYVPGINHRLMLYKKIASIRSEDQIQSIRDEIQDRFGAIPESVEHLLEYGVIKLKAEKLRIRAIDQNDGSIFFQVGEDAQIQPETILSFVRKHGESSLSPSGILKYRGEKLHIPKNLFATLNQLLNDLTSC